MRVLLVEDDKKTRQTLIQGLNEQGWKVIGAANGQEAFDIVKTREFDVIVTDIIMPVQNGFDLVKKLRYNQVQTPILVLTALDETQDKILGLELGADDYLEKPYSFSELVVRIKALQRRYHQQYASRKLEYSDLLIDLSTKEVWRKEVKLTLTPREYALIEYFVKNKEKLVTKSEIAAKVWDINFDTNTNVIEVYINYLRKKIDKPFENPLIHTVRGLGYIFRAYEN